MFDPGCMQESCIPCTFFFSEQFAIGSTVVFYLIIDLFLEDLMIDMTNHSFNFYSAIPIKFRRMRRNHRDDEMRLVKSRMVGVIDACSVT